MATGALLYLGTADGLLIYSATADGATAVGRALRGHAVGAILALDAVTVLLAAEGLPPQQSFDGGASWHDAPGATIEPVGLRAATPHGPAELRNPRLMGATAYARLAGRPTALLGAGAGGALLFRSLDDGIHWEPAPSPEGHGRVTALTPGPGVTAWAGTERGLLLHSDDRGATWREAARVGAGIICMAAVLSSH
jgi:hypothetical protein